MLKIFRPTLGILALATFALTAAQAQTPPTAQPIDSVVEKFMSEALDFRKLQGNEAPQYSASYAAIADKIKDYSRVPRLFHAYYWSSDNTGTSKLSIGTQLQEYSPKLQSTQIIISFREAHVASIEAMFLPGGDFERHQESLKGHVKSPAQMEAALGRIADTLSQLPVLSVTFQLYEDSVKDRMHTTHSFMTHLDPVQMGEAVRDYRAHQAAWEQKNVKAAQAEEAARTPEVEAQLAAARVEHDAAFKAFQDSGESEATKARVEAAIHNVMALSPKLLPVSEREKDVVAAQALVDEVDAALVLQKQAR